MFKKLYNKGTQIVLLFTAQKGLRGDLVGKEGMVCKIDLIWGLIAIIPSLHEMTIMI